MNNPLLENVNIKSIVALPTPAELRSQIPQTPLSSRTGERGRAAIERILDGDDPRFLAIVGPCSIHNLGAAAEYARRLRAVAEEAAGSILVVMRVYFEKPRTTIGWKGLINDPYLNDHAVHVMATGGEEGIVNGIEIGHGGQKFGTVGLGIVVLIQRL